MPPPTLSCVQGQGMTTSPFLCTSRKGPLSCLGQPDHESLWPPTGCSSSWALPERDSLHPACWGKATTDSSGHLQRLVEAGAGWGKAPAGLCLSPRESLMGWPHPLPAGTRKGKPAWHPLPSIAWHLPSATLRGDLPPAVLWEATWVKRTTTYQPMEGILHIWEFRPRHYSKCSDTLAHFIPRGALGGRCYFNCWVTDKRTEAQGAYLKNFTSYSASKEW